MLCARRAAVAILRVDLLSARLVLYACFFDSRLEDLGIKDYYFAFVINEILVLKSGVF